MKIGDKIFVFDQNHRVYPENHNWSSAPIYREHFIEREIVGETSQSWIVGYPGCPVDSRMCTKHKKKGLSNLYTSEQVEEEVYKHDHAHKIVAAVQHVDYKTLKAIAKIIGYEGVSK